MNIYAHFEEIVPKYVRESLSFKISASYLCVFLFPALPCPPNSHYSECTAPCPPTCADLFPVFCPLPPNSCVEGCQCNAGFVLSDGKCVPLSSCGCVDSNGEYHEVSKLWS